MKHILAGAIALLSLAPLAPAQASSNNRGLDSFDAAWQIIHEQHFDPTFNGVDWLEVRERYRPRAEQTNSIGALRLVIRQMLATLQQSHFSLVQRESLGNGSNSSQASPPGTAGFDVRIRQGQAWVSYVQPGGPADLAGIREGWILLAIDDEDVGNMLQSFRKSDTLRPETANRKRLLQRIGGEVGSGVEFLWDTGQGERSTDIVRTANEGTPFNLPGLPTFYLSTRWGRLDYKGLSIGVIHFSNWFNGIEEELEKALFSMRDCDGVILDLRGNSGGSGAMASRLAGHFFAERTSLGVQVMRNENQEYLIRPRQKNRGKTVGVIGAPLAILVDETTGSCSEVFSGGMQALGRARVFGERTAGAGLPAKLTELPNGDYLLHAIGNFLTAAGDSLEGDGVMPDEVVLLERGDLLGGRDRPMTTAARWIGLAGIDVLGGASSGK